MQKVSRICEAKNETLTDELLQAGTDGHPRVWQNVEENSSPGRWQAYSEGGKKLKDRRTKEMNHQKRVSEASEQV